MSAFGGGSDFEDCFVPEAGLELTRYIEAGDLCACHHIVRYQWAKLCLADWPWACSILDIACGSGYGCWDIATTFKDREVTGIEGSSVIVRYAQSNYAAPNLQYKVGDASDLDAAVGNAKFDCIVSFETIEHLDHREAFLYDVVRHIRPAGVFLLSTPVSQSPVFRPEWRGHKLEYSFALLYDFLSRYFRKMLRPDDGTLPHTEAFKPLLESRIGYGLVMNPLICCEPIVIDNPYS